MLRITDTVEHIVAKLLKDQAIVYVSRSLGIPEQTYDQWWSEYGGLRINQLNRLQELERETTRLKRAVTALMRDTLILKETADGNVLAPRADGRLGNAVVPRAYYVIFKSLPPCHARAQRSRT